MSIPEVQSRSRLLAFLKNFFAGSKGTYVTTTAESGLPNESVITAGGNITFDTSVPNVLTIDAAGGGGGDVSVSGTPSNNEVPTWTDSTTIKGEGNLTFDGTTLTTTGLSNTGNTTLGDAAGDTVTVNAGTVTLATAPGIDASENTVLIINSSNVLKRNDIDSKVWAGDLVDYTGTPVNNQVAIWTDTDTLEGDSDLTFDGSNLTVGGDLTVTGGDITLGAANGYIKDAGGTNRITIADDTSVALLSPAGNAEFVVYETYCKTMSDLAVGGNLQCLADTSTEMTLASGEIQFFAKGDDLMELTQTGIGMRGATPIAGLAITGDLEPSGDVTIGGTLASNSAEIITSNTELTNDRALLVQNTADHCNIEVDAATSKEANLILSENGAEKWAIGNVYTNDNLQFRPAAFGTAVAQLTQTGDFQIAGDLTVNNDIITIAGSAEGQINNTVGPLSLDSQAGYLWLKAESDVYVDLDDGAAYNNKGFFIRNGANANCFRVAETGNAHVANDAFITGSLTVSGQNLQFGHANGQILDASGHERISLDDASDTLIRDDDGTVQLRVKDAGVDIDNDLTVDGSTTLGTATGEPTYVKGLRVGSLGGAPGYQNLVVEGQITPGYDPGVLGQQILDPSSYALMALTNDGYLYRVVWDSGDTSTTDPRITFTAGGSGKVVVEISIYMDTNTNTYVYAALSTNSGTKILPASVDVGVEKIVWLPDESDKGTRTFRFFVEGLVGGTSYTWYLYMRNNNSAVSRIITGGIYPLFEMSVRPIFISADIYTT